MSNSKIVAWGKVEIEPYTDDDDFELRSRSNFRQRTLSPGERLLSSESPPKKTRKRTSLKNSVKTTTKICKKKAKTVSTQTNFDIPVVVSPVKLPFDCDFPVGSIVGINGFDLDYGRFKVKKMHPCFMA